MRFWVILGVFLAVAGTLLFWSGLDSRFGKQVPAPVVAVAPADTTVGGVKEELATKDQKTEALPPTKMQSMIDSSVVKKPVSEKPTTARNVESPAAKVVQAVPPSPAPSASVPNISNDPDGRKRHLVKTLIESGWTAEEIAQLTDYLNDPRAHFRHDMLIRNATFKENADQYAHNLTAESIERCMNFLNDQAVPLNHAAIREGVTPDVLVSILRVETNLGTYTGKESVFNVFWSLSIGDDPGVQKEFLPTDPEERNEARRRMLKRSFWARGQLRDLLYVARHGGEDPVGIMGSFAGAFGMSQFIPSSYRAYGRDGNDDGVIDLDNIADATASIAFYLKENGWQNDAAPARKRKVILSYNHSSFYADCVMALADSISTRRNPPQFP